VKGCREYVIGRWRDGGTERWRGGGIDRGGERGRGRKRNGGIDGWRNGHNGSNGYNGNDKMETSHPEVAMPPRELEIEINNL
jgi:hypothetical protein